MGDVETEPVHDGPVASEAPPPEAEAVNPAGTNADADLAERYNKLKAIALKLKKKIGEQNAEIEGLKEDKGRLQNASKIQQEFDKAQDEIERLKKSEATLKKDLEKTVEETVNLKMANIEAASQIQSLSVSHKTLREKLEILEKDSGNVEELRAKAEQLDKELQEARTAGIDAQQEKRQLQILSLEVTDYEKKLSDAYGSLEEKKAEYAGLLKELDAKDAKIEELQTQIMDYKKTEDQLTLSKESFQAEVTRKTEKITFLQEDLTKITEKLSEKRTELKNLEVEFSNSKSAFAAQVKELMDQCGNSDKTISSLEQKITNLEENKRSRESLIANLKLEMQQLDSDYNSYKLKAQTMLKSQKPVTLQENDEVETLHRVVQDFHSEIAILKSELQTKRLENENLLTEKADLNVRFIQVKTDLIEKELQLGNEIQRLKNEVHAKEDQLNHAKEEFKHEMKEAVAEVQADSNAKTKEYESEIRRLKEQILLLMSTADYINSSDNQNSKEADKVAETNMNSRSVLGSVFEPLHSAKDTQFRRISPSMSQPIPIDSSAVNFDQMRMIPRGEGEGSESIVSAYASQVDNYNVSFEQLLSSSFDSISKTSVPDSTQDHIITKEDLTKCHSQINHLTSLLHESEANCERLTQLSEALKEEIRRMEREKERQEHVKENTEYLKNVILKFVTLSGEDERKRLIPVLQTMLRLTADEVLKLEETARGQNASQRSGSSWSSYIPVWSSGETK